MSTLGTNYGISELRIAYALKDAINFYLVDGTMPNDGTLYGISEKRLAIAIAENTSIGGGGSAVWGTITGNLASQSDLSTALSLKQNSLGYTAESVVNKSDSYTVSSSTTYATTKAVVDGLATKQNTLTNPITGTGTSNQIAFWNGTNTQTGSSNLTWDGTNLKVIGKFGINQTTPLSQIDVVNSSATQPIQKWTGTTGTTASLSDSGLLLLPNGTVNQPTHTFTNFTGTGLSVDSSAGQLRLHSTNGVFSFTRSGDGFTKQFFSSFLFESGTWVGSGAIVFGSSNVSDSQLARVSAGKLNFRGSQSQASLTCLGINQASPVAQLDIVNVLNTQPVLKLTGVSGQSANISEVLSSSGSVLSVLSKADGSYQPASLTDSNTTNSSLYYSTTLSRLAYKDSSGNVFAQNQRQFSTKTVDYTLTIADDFVRFNGTSLTATLPNATTMSGHEFEIKNVNSTALTINTTSSQLMDSNLTVSLSQYEVLKVVSNGTNWDII